MTRDLLSQEEVDALLQGVDSGAIETDPAPGAPGVARPYDFAGQERIVRGRMPTLEMINERFVRGWRIGLFDLLRRPAEVSVLGMETLRFGDYLAGLRAPTHLNLVRLKPLRGTGLILFEPRMVHAVVDGFFGGGGRFPARLEERESTPTELRIVQLLLRRTFADLADAWAPVLPLQPEHLGSETNPMFANIVSPREHVVVSRFRVLLEEDSGELHIALPYSMLEPIRELLDAGMQSDRVDNDESWRLGLQQQLHSAEVALSCVLAEKRIDLRRLVGMKVGDILPVDLPKRVPVCVEQIPLFTGEFGICNGNNAVKITAFHPPGAAPARPVAVPASAQESPT